MRNGLALGAALALCAWGSARAFAWTADQPECWLVLYNLNSTDSDTWAHTYAAVRGIPAENLLGLYASTDEHLWDINAAEAQVFAPLRSFLSSHPTIKARLMGIVLGYRMPGHYGWSPGGGPGGYSIASGLHDLNNAITGNNPKAAGALAALPPPLTKTDLPADGYMVCRIDGPDLASAVALTQRALAFTRQEFCLSGQYVYYDYTDAVLPGGTWTRLKEAVTRPSLAALPWRAFDDDTQQTPSDAFRFGTHDVTNWNNGRLTGVPAGARILAYDLDSWGATTVRDPNNDPMSPGAARFVPNALKAGYASAIGATGEPYCCVAPYPWVLVEALTQGRTLGEAFYLSTPNEDWMWECDGDPFLRLPRTFGDLCYIVGDANCDGFINSADVDAFVMILTAPSDYGRVFPGCDPRRADVNSDGVVNAGDIDPFVTLVAGASQPLSTPPPPEPTYPTDAFLEP